MHTTRQVICMRSELAARCTSQRRTCRDQNLVSTPLLSPPYTGEAPLLPPGLAGCARFAILQCWAGQHKWPGQTRQPSESQDRTGHMVWRSRHVARVACTQCAELRVAVATRSGPAARRLGGSAARADATARARRVTRHNAQRHSSAQAWRRQPPELFTLRVYVASARVACACAWDPFDDATHSVSRKPAAIWLMFLASDRSLDFCTAAGRPARAKVIKRAVRVL